MSATVISFLKSSGGVGATSLAVQMACAAKTDLALLDLDIQFGGAAFQMDLKSSTSIIDLVMSPERLDKAMLQGAMVRAHDLFSMLAAPQGIPALDDIPTESMVKVMTLAREAFPLVVTDMPMAWTDWSYATLSLSSCIVLVTTLNTPALRQARRQIDMLKQENLGHLPILLVANMVETGFFATGMTKDDAEKVIGRSIDFIVPRDPVMRRAADAGLPLAAVGGRLLARKLSRLLDLVRVRHSTRIAA